MNASTALAGRRLVLLLLTAVELLVFIDTTVVNIALPRIGSDLHLGESGLGWVVNAYLLSFGGFMLLGGRAADLLGPGRVFRMGVTVFTVGSLVAGLSTTAWSLTLSRAAQGIGAAIVVPAEIALLRTIFPEPEAHRRAFGVWSAMGAAGAAVGTALGGPLTQGLGWESVFLINVPIGVAAMAFGGRLLSADAPRSGPARHLDLPGAVSATAALLLLGYGFGAAGTTDTQVRGWLSVAAGVVLGTAFIGIERRAVRPLVPLRLFRVRQVSGSAAVNALVGAAHVPTFAVLALYLQRLQHYGPTRSGLAVFPIAVVAVVASRTAIPATLKRLGPQGTLTLGMVCQAVAMLFLARLPADLSYAADILPAALILGFGLPAAFVGVTVPATVAVEASDTGVAAGIVNTAQRIGSGLGITVLLLIASAVGSRTGDPLSGLRIALVTAAALAAAGAVLSAALLRDRRTAGPPLAVRAAREGPDRTSGRR